jgi:hypothetical protein
MSKKQSFQIVYKVNPGELELADIVNYAWDIIGQGGNEPTAFILPDGRKIKWNAFLADKFAAEGHISEQEFIEYSLMKDLPVCQKSLVKLSALERAERKAAREHVERLKRIAKQRRELEQLLK